jgi:hypothetical protein
MFPGAAGIAVDPTAAYVAVAQRGVSANNHTGAAVAVLNAANGDTVATLAPGSNHDYTDVAWDNVGNLYTCDNWNSVWRVYSPPGPNAATTFALQNVQFGSAVTAPTLGATAYSGDQFQFTLFGQTNASYIIQASMDLQNWLPILTNSSPDATRIITINAPGSSEFYRALVGP